MSSVNTRPSGVIVPFITACLIVSFRLQHPQLHAIGYEVATFHIYLVVLPNKERKWSRSLGIIRNHRDAINNTNNILHIWVKMRILNFDHRTLFSKWCARKTPYSRSSDATSIPAVATASIDSSPSISIASYCLPLSHITLKLHFSSIALKWLEIAKTCTWGWSVNGEKAIDRRKI